MDDTKDLIVELRNLF